jgi:murein DD-endopeptidase MepM/ murein hydrolase activator NlpD
MRREHHRSLRRRAASLLALLVALTALPAAAPAGAAASGGDTLRSKAAREVRAHEEAREGVERLRRSGADDAQVGAAERYRKAIRSDLWNLLRSLERKLGDPVAVDPYGRRRHCPITQRRVAAPPQRRTWSPPTRHYWLSAGYAVRGSRWKHRHTGQDFAVNAGTPVYAVGPGTVYATTCGDGFGNQVVVRHSDGYFTQYAHLSRIQVRKGQRVAAGQRLGLSGATGNVTGPHLHFEVRITPYMGSSVPPLPWLRRKAVRIDRGAHHR